MRCPKCQGGVEKLMSSFSVDVPDEICARLPRGEKKGSVAPRAGVSRPNVRWRPENIPRREEEPVGHRASRLWEIDLDRESCNGHQGACYRICHP